MSLETQHQPTPETDALREKLWKKSWSDSFIEMMFHANKLERERDEARRSAEQWRVVAAKYAGCTESECNRLPWEEPWDSLHNAQGEARADSAAPSHQKGN